MKRRGYGLEKILNVAGNLIGISDEGYVIAFEDPSLNVLSDKGRANLPLRIHFTSTEYPLIKRLLDSSGQIIPFEELALLLPCPPVHRLRLLAGHIYRMKKKLPRFMIIYCETGNGYSLLILPKSFVSVER